MSSKKRYISNRISLLLLIVLTMLLLLDVFSGLVLKKLSAIQKLGIYIVIYIIPIIVYAKKSKTKTTRMVSLSFVKLRYMPFVLLFGLSTSIICAFINVGTTAAIGKFINQGVTDSTVTFDSDSLFITLLASVILPAVCEELLLRGIALTEYSKYGVSVSVIMTSVIFALFHGNVMALPSLFVAGVFYAILTHLLKSVWPAIICHVINNALAFYISTHSDFINYLLDDALFLVIFICVLFIILYLTLRLTEGIIDDFSGKKRLKTNTKRLAYGDPMGSLYIWIFFALSIFICVRNAL